MLTYRGRHYRWAKKALVSDHYRLDAHRMLSATDMSQPSMHTWQWLRGEQRTASLAYQVRPEHRTVRLVYSYQGQEVAPYLVHWTTTTPRYGGQRYWWLCPQCGRRCAHLYSGKIFACRRCYHLTYESAQSGDPRNARVERRMWAIRRRLQAEGGLIDTPAWRKPPHMHWRTFRALMCEYEKLELIWLGDFELQMGLAAEHPELPEIVDAAWADYQRDPTAAERSLRLYAADEAAAPPPRRRPLRRTLGQTAQAAEIPLDFAREAQAEGLLRPDAGRTTRRKRYRPKVASWLMKLHTLRQAGYTWAELRAWSARRFTPGYEHERRWPAGYVAAG